MIDRIPEPVKVYSAGLFAITQGFFEWSQPILQWLLTAGQIAVAVAAALYTFAKWQAMRKNKK